MASPPERAVAALESCFRALPADAVPAVVDCVLASSTSTSPTLLFDALLHSSTSSQEQEQEQGLQAQSDHHAAISRAAALCHLLAQFDSPPKAKGALRLLLWRVFLPLLRDDTEPNYLALLHQATVLMCDVITSTGSWDLLGVTIVPFCVHSSAVALGMSTSHDSMLYHGVLGPDFAGDNLPRLLPLSKSSSVLASLLGDMLERRRAILTFHEGEGADDLNVLVQNLTWDLSKLVLKMFAHGQEHRSCAVRILLHPLFISLGDVSCVTVTLGAVQHKLSRFGFLECIWDSCISLLSLGCGERLDAFNILSLYLSTLKLGHQVTVLGADKVKEFDLRNVSEFWDELRGGLVDKDSLVRKQAFYVLTISLSIFTFPGNEGKLCSSKSSAALPAQTKSTTAATKRERWANKEARSLGVREMDQLGEQCSNGQDRWKVFLLLYEMLQEYGTHLVEAAWTHHVVLLLESAPRDDYLNHTCHGAFHSQMESWEGILHWMAVLWENGLTHDNPQVRCLVMQSFLDIAWEHYKVCAQMIPRSFVLGPLIRGLNDVVHHKDFGIGGVYNSKTIKGAERFFSTYAQNLTRRDRIHLVWSLASAAKQDSFGRAGLMTLASCVASCICQSDTNDTPCTPSGKEVVKCGEDVPIEVSSADLLDVLWILCERSKQHFNPKYRLKVCEQVIKVATSLINATEIPLNQLLHFISTIPREFTDYFGPLRAIVQKWFVQKKECFVGNALLSELIDFPTTFMKHKQDESSILFDDEDVSAWEAEARRWARILLLVTSEGKHLKRIFGFLEAYGYKLPEECPIGECIPIKYFIIVLSFIEELEVNHKRLGQNNTILAGVSDRPTVLELHGLNEKLAGSLSLVLENMVVFAELSCSVFWLRNMENADLPYSVKGKLGGPSQRRLATSTTSSVLQGIWSMRFISSVASWCNHYSSGASFSCIFSFLWDFYWKVIQHPINATESGSELHLAAYETVAYVLAALSTARNSHFLDFVESMRTNQASDFSLDILVTTFLDNINHLLADGIITRSRRAVLMTWKWLCVDSLLSILSCCSDNGSQQKRLDPLFSDSTLRCIFLDIIESLENAGENSVLSILRCVRSVLGLLHLNAGNKKLASLGISYEMMMQLVKSSWILHLSCNKRRVAAIAALLSAVLHPAIFCNLEMHQTNEEGPGPLKWFIENLFSEGSKSPRTIRLAALHLSGLWLMYPKTLRFYIEELKLLSLYGSVAFDEDFEAELSENYEARFEVSMLAQSPDREFTEVFINTELYARISVAVLFHQLWKQIKEKGAMETEEALQSGKLFLLKLLDSAVNDKDLSKELYKKYSSVHRHKVRVWQMLCVLSHYVEDDIVGEVTSSTHICLYRNNLPAVRQYLETFAILLYLKFPTLAEEQLVTIFHDKGMRQQALSSYVFIAANVILHSRPLSVQMNHLNQLLPPMLPFLTSHHHSLRGFTQLLVHSVLSRLWPALRVGTSEDADFERRCFEDLRHYLAENSDCVRLRVSIEGFLDVFDPNVSGTPWGIFRARPEVSEFECVPVSMMERVIEFLNDVREDLRHAMAKDTVTIKNEDLAVEEHRAGGLTEPTTIQDALDFQKKITPHRDPSGQDIWRLISEMEEDDQLFSLAVDARLHAAERLKQSRQELIVVASLVDRIPNLAGLTRTCEVFRAAVLVVADKSVLEDKQFRLISVTAEKWVPVLEVPVDSVRAFLEKKRAEGFSLLGLEQTAHSRPMGSFPFPRRSVLLLGREKEGIPADLIHVLDACLEIPQLGVVRSLNVHVSGAIAVWEYTRQHLKQS